MPIAAGYVYGFWAFPLTYASIAFASVLAFLAARYLLRDKIQPLLNRRPKYRKLDRAVADDGWQVVVLMRLSPIVPFNLQNYFFGATEVGFLPYMVATFFGIMPGAAFYVYLGTLGREAGSGGAGAARWILLGSGLALTALVLFLVIRRANARLTELGIARTIGRGGR